MIKRLKNRIKNYHGQGMTEYILLLVIIIALAMAFKDPIINAVKNKTSQVEGQIMGFNP